MNLSKQRTNPEDELARVGDRWSYHFTEAMGLKDWSIPWRLWLDTARPSPHDIGPWGSAASITTATYTDEARSVVVLFVLLSDDGAGDGTPILRS